MMPCEDAVAAAVQAARDAPGTVDAADLSLVLSAIEAGSDQQRRAAAVGLAAVAADSPDALLEYCERIRALLTDDDVTVRAMAAAALADVAATDPDAAVDAVPRLAAELDDDTMVRRHALGALAYVADARPAAVSDAIPAVVSVLEEQPADPVVRGYTMATLVAYVRTHEPPASVGNAVPALLGFIDDADTDVTTTDIGQEAEPVAQARADVAQAETTTRNDALTVLVAAARHHPALVSAHLDSVISRLDPEVTPVCAGMAETIQHVADSAPAASRRAIDPLSACLRADATAAAAAMRALATIAEHAPDAVADGVAPEIDHVIARLDHEDPAVRAAATGLVAYLAEERPELVRSETGTLLDRLSDDHLGVRGQAMWALGLLGAEDALPELDERARADADPELRELAEEMATRIRGASGESGP